MLNTLNGQTLTVSINGAVVKFVSGSGSSTTVITADVDSSNACVLERAQARRHARTQRAHPPRPIFLTLCARAGRAIHVVDTVVLPSGISPVPSKSGSASIAVSLASALVAVVAVALSL